MKNERLGKKNIFVWTTTDLKKERVTDASDQNNTLQT